MSQLVMNKEICFAPGSKIQFKIAVYKAIGDIKYSRSGWKPYSWSTVAELAQAVCCVESDKVTYTFVGL